MASAIQLTASLEQLNFYKTRATGSQARALVFNDLPGSQVDRQTAFCMPLLLLCTAVVCAVVCAAVVHPC